MEIQAGSLENCILVGTTNPNILEHPNPRLQIPEAHWLMSAFIDAGLLMLVMIWQDYYLTMTQDSSTDFIGLSVIYSFNAIVVESNYG